MGQVTWLGFMVELEFEYSLTNTKATLKKLCACLTSASRDHTLSSVSCQDELFAS